MTSHGRAGLTVIAAAALTAAVLPHMGAGHTSATFDEIILVSGGLRGIEEQHWDMITDQSPLMMYAYGLAASSARAVRPTEDREWLFDDRWDYARELFFRLGNDPTELLTTRGFIALQVHSVSDENVGLGVQWRRIRIKEIPF